MIHYRKKRMTETNKEIEVSLPKEWKRVRLGDVCKLKNGFAFKSNDYVNEGIPILRISDIKTGSVRVDRSVRVVLKKEYEEYVVLENDILVAMSGATTGKFGIYKSTDKAYQNQRVGKFQILDKKKLENEFLFYQLHALKRQIEKDAYGGAQPNISSGKIEAMEILLPPKAIQQAIVSKIEEFFSELDKGIENLRTAQQQLKTYRQAVLKWAFEGRLTNENVKDGVLPKGWKMVSIEEIATVGTGATPLKSRSDYYGGNIAWVTSGALNDEYVREATDFVTEKAVKETNLSVYPKHTLLVAMYGEGKTRGKCSELLIEACTNQAIAAIYFDENQEPVKPYLKYFLLKNYTDVRKKSSGGVQPNLNLSIIKKLQFPLATFKEQRAIINEIESRLSVADKMEESITQSLQQAEGLRQSILKKAFEGRLI